MWRVSHNGFAVKKETRVSVRIDDDLKKLVRDVVDQTNISETTLVEATLRAICDYFAKHGEITLPLVILPKSAVKKKPGLYRQPSPSGARRSPPSSPTGTVHGLNEPSGKYKAKTKGEK